VYSSPCYHVVGASVMPAARGVSGWLRSRRRRTPGRGLPVRRR